MWNPFSGAVDRTRAHPFQTGLSTLAGMVLPGGNWLANLGFNAYNNHQFNNAFQQNLSHMAGLGNGVNWQTPDYGMNNDPAAGLQGPSGTADRGGPGGPTMDFGPGIGAGYNAVGLTPGSGFNTASMFGPGSQGSWGQQGNPGNLLGFLGAGPQQQQAGYLNSPQAGGNLGIGLSNPGTGMGGGMPSTGYSQAGGGYGTGVWNGGGGMHSFSVNSGSLSPSNYGGLGGGGIARGRGRENGASQN